MSPYRSQIHTIGYERLDFSEHQNIAQTLSANIYFANPFSFLETGLDEYTNGLIRQYLP
jgi:transposase, IS30 family